MSFVTTLAEALFVLRVDDSKVDPELEKATQKFKKRMDAVGKIAEGVRNAAAVALVASVAMIHSFADAATEKEAQISRFHAQMEILGGVFDDNAHKTEVWASKMEKLHDFDAEDILQAFQRAGSVTKDYGDSVLFAETAMEAANLKGKDLAQTEQALAMAYAGNTRGLKNLGIILQEGVKGHQALVDVYKQVAGGSEKTADTVQRAERAMLIAWENSREKLGSELRPALIKVYGTLGDLAGQMENVNGSAVLVAGGIAGVVVVVTQGVIWVSKLQEAMVILRLATVSTDGTMKIFGNTMTATTLKAGALVAALALVVAEYNRVAQAAQKASAAQGSNAGGDGTDNGIWTTNASGDRVLQSSKQISAESDASAADLMWANYNGFGAEARKIREQGMRADQANESIAALKRQVAQQRAEKSERTARNSSYYPNQKAPIDQELAGII